VTFSVCFGHVGARLQFRLPVAKAQGGSVGAAAAEERGDCDQWRATAEGDLAAPTHPVCWERTGSHKREHKRGDRPPTKINMWAEQLMLDSVCGRITVLPHPKAKPKRRRSPALAYNHSSAST
jgi:hypothetical protein